MESAKIGRRSLQVRWEAPGGSANGKMPQQSYRELAVEGKIWKGEEVEMATGRRFQCDFYLEIGDSLYSPANKL